MREQGEREVKLSAWKCSRVSVRRAMYVLLHILRSSQANAISRRQIVPPDYIRTHLHTYLHLASVILRKWSTHSTNIIYCDKYFKSPFSMYTSTPEYMI